MNWIKRFLSKLLICAMAVLLIVPSYAASNLPMSEIGDQGTWATESNIELFKTDIKNDMTAFQSEFQTNQLVEDYVPIEAKVGLAFMNALSLVGDVIDNSLVRFVIIFIIVAYIFWVMFEAYNMITKGSSAMELGENLVKKGAIIAIWIIILVQGPAEVFMWIMGPIIGVGSYLSDLILNAVANVAGAQIPDTCAAIRDYAATHTSARMLLDANAAADILCVPTRLSGFFYTAVAAGWQWMIAGIGTSAFTVLVGAIFIVIFIYNIWKFALMALGVIMDLFLAVLLLPFTAIAETIGKTSYKGIAGDIFNGFLGIFKVESLSTQIQRFINAAIYFVSLSIVIALCAALLSGTVSANLAAQVPTLENSNFVLTLLTGCLVAHLANRASEIAKNLGGSINDSFGGQFGKDMKTLWNKTSSTGKNLWKIIRSGKK